MLPLTYLSTMAAVMCLTYLAVRLYQANMGPARAESADPLGALRPIVRLLAPLNRRAFPKYSQRSAIELRFSGLHKRLCPEEFLAIKELAALFFIGLGELLLLGCDIANPLLLVPGALIGFAYPGVWLSSRVKKRRRRLARELPSFLDFLLVSMAAGIDFRRAVQLAAQQLLVGPVAEEFGDVLRELQVGTSFSDALHDLADRARMPEISSFVSTVLQCEQAGASMQEALRAQSEVLRARRFQLAEEQAGKAPVKILFPLILLIMPCLLLLTLLPLGIEVYMSLKGAK